MQGWLILSPVRKTGLLISKTGAPHFSRGRRRAYKPPEWPREKVRDPLHHRLGLPLTLTLSLLTFERLSGEPR